MSALTPALLEELAGLAHDEGLLRLGAVRLDHPGFAPARARLDEHLDAGHHGEMEFMARTREVRKDPARMLEGARTVLVAAVPYRGEPGPVARYARSADYHTVIHRRLDRLAEHLHARLPKIRTLVCVDTKPLLERAAAALAGLGFLGKHGCLIVPGLGSTVLLGALFILVPLWLGTRRGGLQRPSPRLLGYFAMLGIGFMMVEIPTIQKLTVYLGRPVYSLAVVLFSLLLFSGLGSFWSNGWDDQTRRRLVARLFPALVGVTLLHMLFAGTLLAMTLAFGLTARIIMAVLLLAPLGFLLGIPFPTGIRWAGQNRPGVIPWLWGINGVMSVLGSALATLFAIHIGFRLTLLLAALVYVAAGWLFMTELGVKWRGEETAVSASQTPQTSI